MDEHEVIMSMDELASIVDEQWVFDISKISSRNFENVLCGLIKHAKEFTKLVFCMDHYHLISGVSSTSRLHPKEIQNPVLAKSAFIKNKIALPTLILALKHMLPRCVNLLSLEFRNLSFNSAYMQKFITAIEKVRGLKHLIFNNVTIGDDGAEILFKTLKTHSITYLCLNSCGLTDASSSNLKAFLTANAKSYTRGASGSKQNTLQSLEIRDNGFSYRLLLELGDALARIPLRVLDMRHNQLIDNEMASNIKHNIKGLDVRVNDRKCKPCIPPLPTPVERTEDSLEQTEVMTPVKPKPKKKKMKAVKKKAGK